MNLSFLLTDLLTYLLTYVVNIYQCAIASHKMLRVCIALCVVYVSLSCLFVFVCTLHVCAYMYVACMHVFACAWHSAKQVRSLVDPNEIWKLSGLGGAYQFCIYTLCGHSHVNMLFVLVQKERGTSLSHETDTFLIARHSNAILPCFICAWFSCLCIHVCYVHARICVRLAFTKAS